MVPTLFNAGQEIQGSTSQDRTPTSARNDDRIESVNKVEPNERAPPNKEPVDTALKFLLKLHMYDSDEDVYRFETKIDCDCPAEEYGGLNSVTLENLLDYVAQKVPYLRDGQYSLHESRFSILHPTMAFVEHLALFAISGTSIGTRPEPRLSEAHTAMRQKLVTCQNFRRIPYRPQPEYIVPMEIPHIIEALHYTWQNAPLFGGNNAAWNELLFKALLWFESKDRLVKIIFRGRPVEDKKGSRSFCFGARGICREMIDVMIVSTDSKHCNHYKHVVKDTRDLTTFQDLFETVSNATWSPYYPNEPPVSVKRVVVLASEDIGKDVYKLAAEIHLRVVKQECNTVKKLLPRSVLPNSGWKHIRLGPNGYFDIKKDLEPVGDLEDKWKRLLDIHKKTVLNSEFNFRIDSIFIMPIDPKNPKYGAQAILCRGNIPPVPDEIVPGKFSTDDIPDANGRMACILQYPSAKKELEWKV